MATIIRMPEVLANATEAIIAAWLIEEGTHVAVGDTLAEIETEKAVVEYGAELDGVLARHLAAPGQTVDVGAPIALLLAIGEDEPDLAGLLGNAATPGTASSHAPVPADDGRAPVRRFASPLARKMAKDRGIDLARLTGSGPQGRIVRRDIEAYLAPVDEPGATDPASTGATPAAGAQPSAAAAPTGVAPTFTEVLHTGMRRAIARRLTESKSSVPHFYVTADCRADELLDLRARINTVGTVKVSVNDLVVKAAAAAFREVPEANVIWTDTALRRFTSVDIAVAVATDGGLLTPVLRGVDTMSLSQVSAVTAELAGRARQGRLRQEELEGGSFTVSNLGMYGTKEFSAILNPPQSAILAVGAALDQPVVADGVVQVGKVMRCTLSADHRAIDGALAAQWLRAFQTAIENPLAILV
ncbi:dihydrolipoamide acetyltransferase family protein [Georgenia sp. SYP-B2076]|uniref:dihydrolipoamide acetyltransferase family protein n=1 Tax=Georgenia sp. SYP-B2076 TaxID=2495881 RepID=UPI000F8F4C00|nr:dihydrolipoamide acetyltransferase family protein [Georgenia sp. SYP-B2076]